MIKESVKNQSLSRIENVQSHVYQSLNEVVVNVRWIATLILAEIAGLAGYRKLLGQESLSVSFAFVVLLLAISLGLFLLSAYLTRGIRESFSERLVKVIDDLHNIDQNGNLSENDANDRALGTTEAFWRESLSIPKKPWIWEFLGVASFLVASALAGIFIFFSEVDELVRSFFV